MMTLRFQEGMLVPGDGATPGEGTVSILPLDEAKTLAQDFPEVYAHVLHHAYMRHTGIEQLADFLFGTFQITDMLLYSRREIFFYVNERFLVILCPTKEDCQKVAEALQGQKLLSPTTGGAVLRFFRMLLRDDSGQLQALEERIGKLEGQALDGEIEDFQQAMAPIRKELLYRHSFYEQMADIAQVLYENDANYFADSLRTAFHQLTVFVQRLLSTSQMLRDYSLQVQSIYQSEIDIRQNNIMRVLTVVTTIFLPLSLITSWYGMNFSNMPELDWEFGYAMVIGLSVVVILISILIFKKKKYL